MLFENNTSLSKEDKMSRIHVLRKSVKDHNNDAFGYPFGEMEASNYPVADIVKPLLTQTPEMATALAGDFPYNISEWLWSSPGQNDENPWLLLCRLNTGAYAFYRAGCDYTGFDCQGWMGLTVSKELADVVEHGMQNYDYEQYEAETEVV
jgi:hypothetical protein